MPRTPISERINLRIVVFAGLVCLLIGYPLYVYLDNLVSGGIKDLGDGVKFVDLKTMSSFVFDQVNGRQEDVPEKWRALSGQKVVLEGEMWAPQAAGPKVDFFQLCYSIAKCCFSGPPQVQHFVDCRMADGSLAPYYSGLVRVVGTLHVNVRRDPEAGKVATVFQMDVESITPK
ncbi:MAG: hypothetical protein NZ561_00055 [Phycisphaerae bacterium]|nr:hypothetical protein [Phycisphaerae bacterium]